MQPSVEQSPVTTVAASIDGDVLEAVLSHLPLIDLVPKSLVSKAMYKAVTSTLLKPPKSQPWFIIYTQGSRSPYLTKTVAYDPATRQWIQIHRPSIDYVSPLRSSQSNLLYMISPSKFSFSFDPLHMTWQHAVAPRVWRMDPMVAVVGKHVVVAGGACDFEHDPLAVEIYDVDSQSWTKTEPMPEFFKGSASPTWQSIASDDHRLFVVEKISGLLHTFDPSMNTWYGPYDLLPGRLAFHSSIGFYGDRLILIGMLGDPDEFTGIKLWEVSSESLKCNDIAEMPANLVEKLKGDDFQVSTIEWRIAGNVAYIYKSMQAEEVIACEFSGGGGCNWWSMAIPVAIDRSITERCVLTCSNVGIDDLQRATRSTVNLRFKIEKFR